MTRSSECPPCARPHRPLDNDRPCFEVSPNPYGSYPAQGSKVQRAPHCETTREGERGGGAGQAGSRVPLTDADPQPRGNAEATAAEGAGHLGASPACVILTRLFLTNWLGTFFLNNSEIQRRSRHDTGAKINAEDCAA